MSREGPHDVRQEVIDSSVIAGQGIYSNAVLAVYDFYVLGISNSFAWKCKTTRLLELYNRYVSSNHLDVQVNSVLPRPLRFNADVKDHVMTSITCSRKGGPSASDATILMNAEMNVFDG